MASAYGSPSLHHHIHQYLGTNEGFKTPPSRYHSHHGPQYNNNHHSHHYHHPTSAYTETFLNYGRFAGHELPIDIGRGQEATRSSYAHDSDGTGRLRDTALAFEVSQRSSQLPSTNAAISQPQIIDATTTSKIEQAPYTCLGVGSCVC